MTDGPILGIDLGTTNSVMTVYQEDGPKVVLNSRRDRITPSVVTYTDSETLIGQPADNVRKRYPGKTLEQVKKDIGKDWEDDRDKRDKYTIDGKMYSPVDVSEEILRKLKRDAEDFFQDSISRCIITVPAGWGNAEREATKIAAERAGFEVERLLHEPSAAAIAYGIDIYEEQTLFVYDLGGGTFDASVLEVGGGICEANATGTAAVGGSDCDEALYEFALDAFEEDHGTRPADDDHEARQRLLEEVRKKKHELSNREEVTIRIPFFCEDQQGEPQDLEVDVDREEFTGLISGILSKTREKTQQVVDASDYDYRDIDSVLLIGGATQMPQVDDIIDGMFESPVQGNINPDETVALGAGIQAGIESGSVKDMMVIDVTPLSFGIKVKGGLFERVIERSTRIPTEVTQDFTTSEDNQRRISVEVYQGEREIADHNHHVGGFVLSGIPPAPAGVPNIKVRFSIDDDGIISVEAVDTGTGNSQHLEISEGLSLTGREIERQKAEARRLSEYDQKYRRHTTTVNQAEEAISRAQTLINKNNDIISPELENKIQTHIQTVRESLDDIDTVTPQSFDGSIDDEALSAVEEMTEELSQVLQDVGVSVYLSEAEDTLEYAPGDDLADEIGDHDGGINRPNLDEIVTDSDVDTTDDRPPEDASNGEAVGNGAASAGQSPTDAQTATSEATSECADDNGGVFSGLSSGDDTAREADNTKEGSGGTETVSFGAPDDDNDTDDPDGSQPISMTRGGQDVDENDDPTEAQ